MKMILFHGRNNPNEDPDDRHERGGWGYDGPTLDGVTGLYATYGTSTVRIHFATDEQAEAARQITGWEVWDDCQLLVKWHEDLIRTCENGGFCYYGDWSIVSDEEAATDIGTHGSVVEDATYHGPSGIDPDAIAGPGEVDVDSDGVFTGRMHPAQRLAQTAAQENGYDPEKVRRVLDLAFPDHPPCWLVAYSAAEKWSILVYEDEPDTIVSAGNYRTRFLNAPED